MCTYAMDAMDNVAVACCSPPQVAFETGALHQNRAAGSHDGGRMVRTRAEQGSDSPGYRRVAVEAAMTVETSEFTCGKDGVLMCKLSTAILRAGGATEL